MTPDSVCGGEAKQALPLPADAQPPVTVIGTCAHDVGRREGRAEWLTATDVGGQVLDGVVSEWPMTLNMFVPPA